MKNLMIALLLTASVVGKLISLDDPTAYAHVPATPFCTDSKGVACAPVLVEYCKHHRTAACKPYQAR